jgi:putative oxidoreductase
MSFSETISPLLGRLALAWFFLSGVANVLGHWDSTIALMEDKHVPVAQLLLVLALIAMVLGSFALFFGFHTRHGAVLLFGFTVVASVLMHDFWRIADPAARTTEYEIFSRNIAIAGGLLMLVGVGPGPFGIDNRGQKKPRR